MDFWKSLSAELENNGFSAPLIKQLQLRFGHLDAAALLALAAERLAEAMTEAAAAERPALADRLRAIATKLAPSAARPRALVASRLPAPQRAILDTARVRSPRELRTVSRLSAPQLRDLGLDDVQVKALEGFASLDRLFRPEVALALSLKGIAGGAALTAVTDAQFAAALDGVLDEQAATTELRRFRDLRDLSTRTSPDAITGLRLDLGEQVFGGLGVDATVLAEGGVDVLSDWAHHRDLAVKPATRAALDGHLRMASLGLEPRVVEHLRDHEIDSAFGLSRLSPDALKDLAGSGNVPRGVLEQAQQLARSGTADLLRGVFEDGAAFPLPRDVPDWLDLPRACVDCPDRESVFSPFAYFVYLVEKTGKTVSQLGAALHQRFSSLSPADGVDTVPQVTICNEVLRRALGARTAQTRPVTQYRTLAILRALVPHGPAQLVARMNAPGLLGRLTAAYAAPPPATDAEMVSPEPAFSDEELVQLQRVSDEIRAELLRAEPAFATATALQVTAELATRVPAAITVGAALVERAVLLDALRLDRAAVFTLYFIEGDLGGCERVTRLDQAIRTLQAYLTATGIEQPASYRSWRGEVLGIKYPEVAILSQDDMLVGGGASWDRGSILRDHARQHAALTAELQAVRAAADAARIDLSRRTVSDATFRRLPSFKDEPTYGTFLAGVSAIEGVLAANHEAYLAAAELDREEPGLALRRLGTALATLNAVEGAVVHGDPARGDDDSPRIQYEELLRLDPVARRDSLERELESYRQAPKRLYETGTAEAVVDGLTDQALAVGHPAWSASPELENESVGVIRRNGASSSTKYSELRYDRGQDLRDFTFSVELMLTSFLETGSEQRPSIGLGVRLQGAEAGYRVAVIPVSHSGSSEQHLAIQRVAAGGTVTTLASAHIGYSSRTDIEGSTLRRDHWYGLTVTVSGSALRASLRITAARTVTVETTDGALREGTLSMFVRGRTEVRFRKAAFRPEEATGAAPFCAPRRQRLPARQRAVLDDLVYWDHAESGASMEQDLLSAPLLVDTPDSAYHQVQLAGATHLGSDVFLTFPLGAQALALDALDRLLERCLMLAYYLRFVVIPVRMAQAHLALGELRTAADLLRLIYDESPDQDAQRPIYPFLYAPAWRSGADAAADAGPDAAAMRLRLGEVYLRWAESLFRQNTDESRYEARRLYERVLRLHDSEGCGCVARQLAAATHVVALASASGATRQGVSAAREVVDRNTRLSASDVRNAPTWDSVQSTMATRRDAYRAKLRERGTVEKLASWSTDRIELAELELARRPELGDLGGQFLTRVDVSPLEASLCTPDSPPMTAQVREACLMLDLLRNCLNILGYRNNLVPPMRFDALVRVARSFSDLALAAERDLLQFRQAFEQEAFALMQAEAALRQADAQETLERLNVELAEAEVELAAIQRDQVQAGVAHFEALVAEGMSDTERRALGAARTAAGLATAGAIFGIGAALPGALMGLASGNPFALMGLPAQLVHGVSQAAGAQSQALSMQASLERQQQDRAFQLQQQRFSLAAVEQSLATSSLRVAAAQLREGLAGLQRDLASDSLAFLDDKTLSAAGWLVLLKVIRDQYRRRLTYAIEAAFLAERALAFELQRPALSVIKFDYYDPRKDGALGATQLLTDLTQLESLELVTRTRKLQLTKTISLAETFPAAFESFREGNGVFPFSTLTEMFDRDFPGHYMRQIQSVRMTVVALVPPHQGIRATLRSSGVSRVVVGPPYAPGYEARTLQRAPESVALSVPFQASGLFVLDYKDELLLPFEGSGVVGDWSFELPRAANPFDFRTIADVLMTIEYTALEGTSARRAEVIRGLGEAITVDRPFSLRRQFPDAWYDLQNPSLVRAPQQPLTVTFSTRRDDFAPHLSNLTIQQVALLVVRKSGVTEEVRVRQLLFHEQEAPAAVGGSATTVEGIASTRQGSAPAWAPILGHSPIGTWTLALDDDAQGVARRLLRDGLVEDILVMLTIGASTPAWPA